MGGSINVESKVGEGSKFNLVFKVITHPKASIPLIVSEEKDDFINDSFWTISRSLLSDDHGLKGTLPRVLIVNDEQFLLEGYMLQLQPLF
jgi:hypothetical protein